MVDPENGTASQATSAAQENGQDRQRTS